MPLSETVSNLLNEPVEKRPFLSRQLNKEREFEPENFFLSNSTFLESLNALIVSTLSSFMFLET